MAGDYKDEILKHLENNRLRISSMAESEIYIHPGNFKSGKWSYLKIPLKFCNCGLVQYPNSLVRLLAFAKVVKNNNKSNYSLKYLEYQRFLSLYIHGKMLKYLPNIALPVVYNNRCSDGSHTYSMVYIPKKVCWYHLLYYWTSWITHFWTEMANTYFPQK